MLIRHELRHARALGAVSACLLVAACGLKGPLFMRPEPANFPPIAPHSAVKPVCRAPVAATGVAPAAVTASPLSAASKAPPENATHAAPRPVLLRPASVPAAATVSPVVPIAAPDAGTSALPVCLPVPTTAAAPVAATGTPPRP